MVHYLAFRARLWQQGEDVPNHVSEAALFSDRVRICPECRRDSSLSSTLLDRSIGDKEEVLTKHFPKEAKDKDLKLKFHVTQLFAILLHVCLSFACH